jgi:hypothetical protein
MKIELLQPALSNLSAEAYDKNTPICWITNEMLPIYTTIKVEEQKSPKHTYYVFLIEKRIKAESGKSETVEQKRTTHYHKAIGIAVNLQNKYDNSIKTTLWNS